MKIWIQTWKTALRQEAKHGSFVVRGEMRRPDLVTAIFWCIDRLAFQGRGPLLLEGRPRALERHNSKTVWRREKHLVDKGSFETLCAAAARSPNKR